LGDEENFHGVEFIRGSSLGNNTREKSLWTVLADGTMKGKMGGPSGFCHVLFPADL